MARLQRWMVMLALLAAWPALALETGAVSGRVYTPQDSTASLSLRQLQDLRALGLSSVRVEFEDRDGAAADRVAAYKQLLVNARKAGLQVIGVLTWASMGDQSVAPAQTTGPADFDTRFVPRFRASFDWHDATYANVDGQGSGITAWELWNEPDVYGFRKSTGAFMGEEFGLLCVRVYEAYRARGGVRKVMIGGISRMDDSTVLKGAFDSTPIRNFRAVNSGKLPGDLIAIHGYGNSKRPSRTGYAKQGGTFRDQVVFFLGLKDTAGRELIPKTQPLYMTEVGYGPSRSGSGVDFLRQGTVAAELQYVLSTLTQFPQFQRAYWYVMRDDELVGQADPRGQEWYGLRSVPQPTCGNAGVKLSYNVLANFHGHAGIGQTQAWQAVAAGDESWAEGTRSVPACGSIVPGNPHLRAFHRNDGADNAVGHPSDNGGGAYVHAWGNGTIQDFSGGALEGGLGSIGLLTGKSEAGYVYGLFWRKWLDMGGAGALGYPFDSGGGPDRHSWSSAIASGMVQDFTGGSLGQVQLQLATGASTVFYVYGTVLSEYLRVGAVGSLGYTTTDLVLVSGQQWRQNFQRGFVLLDAGTNTASAFDSAGRRL
jgi:hypothetical protein